MNTLLILFAFPIAVIIFSIILEKLLNCPIAVASLIFAIFLVITFAAFDETFLIATLAYTIIAFIVAFVVRLLHEHEGNNSICNTLSNLIQNNNGNNKGNDNNENTCETIENILNNNSNNTNNSNCGCNRYRRF